jgi:hypothetical protein
MKTLAAALSVVPALAMAQPATGGGIPFPPQVTAPPALGELARAALWRELHNFDAYPPMTAARLDLGRKAWLVMANFGDACGHAVGCPTAIVVREGATWKAVWTGMTYGRGAVLSTSHDGLRDVEMAERGGLWLLRFAAPHYYEAGVR